MCRFTILIKIRARNNQCINLDKFQKLILVHFGFYRCLVLNDPKKRDNYDKYGVADLEGIDIEDFMGSFGGFQEFLSEFLSVIYVDSRSLTHSRLCLQAWIRKNQRNQQKQEAEQKAGKKIICPQNK